MKLLSILIPVIALTSCAATRQSVEQTVPERFRGEWNSERADCGVRENDSTLTISANQMDLYESSGPVLGVFSNDPREVLIVANISGEGETSISTFRFSVSADGNRLTYFNEVEPPFERYRCPTARGSRQR